MGESAVTHVGRVVATSTGEVRVYEYGAGDGQPVLAFHGVPACGAGFAWADGPARERGVRLIAPDRPGIGAPARAPLASVGDYASHVAALADALGLDRFAVLGYSGGGPYAVAVAARLGARVLGTVVAAGMGQVGVWASADDFERTDRRLLDMARRRPHLARAVLGFAGRAARVSPRTALKSFEKQLAPSDAAVIGTLGPPRAAMAAFTEAFSHGAAGVVADYACLAKPWDVRWDDIATPMWVFHGAADTMVPLAHAHSLVERVPHATLRVWDAAGHLAPIAHIDEILDTLRGVEGDAVDHGDSDRGDEAPA